MPLHDHFHSPWRDEHYWEGFHSAWVNTMVRHLNGALLPPQFRAVPQVHLGTWVEADIATFKKNGHSPAGEGAADGSGVATALWAPPRPRKTHSVDFVNQETYEVQVVDESRGARLVGVVELVSPGNKDRVEKANAFTSKCAGYLQQQIGLIVVDVITTRKVNFHKKLIAMLSDEVFESPTTNLYAVAYRTRSGEDHWRLDTWPVELRVRRKLPTLPLWIGGDEAVPLDLEKTYQETCQVLRIA